MPELDDHELLAAFGSGESEGAFAPLVGRYVDLVYSDALRSIGHRDRAEKTEQAVFIILARKAQKPSRKNFVTKPELRCLYAYAQTARIHPD